MHGFMLRICWWILTISLLSLGARDAAAICREVTEQGSVAPTVTPDQEILVIKRTGVPVGCEQPSTDGGAPDGAPPDAAAPDASTADAAASDAATADAGPPDGGTCTPRTGNTVTWIVQPRFSVGPDGSRFALLMVTPRAPLIEAAPASTFEDLARATRPREIVEERYVEDESLGYQCQDPKFGGGGCGGTTSSGGTGDWTPPDPSGGIAADAGNIDDYVKVTTIGSYQVVVLTATDGDSLAEWLDGAGYTHGDDDIDAIRPYLELGWTVTAVRINSGTVDGGGLEPLSFTFEGDDLRLPLGISRQPFGGFRALLKVYIAAEGRYEVPGAALSFAGWTPDDDRTFLTASFLDFALDRTAEEDPVAARALIDASFQEEYTLVREIRIPSSYCPSGGGDDGDEIEICGCGASGSPVGQAGTLLLAVACAAIVLRRRRKSGGNASATGPVPPTDGQDLTIEAESTDRSSLPRDR